MNIVTSQCKTTLLLNNAWQPINAITARAAFSHLLKGHITALDKNNNVFHSLERWNKEAELYEDQPVIRSAKGVWPIPTVIIVTSKFFRRPRKKKLTTLEMAKIYNFTCQYCLNKFSASDLTIDHINPRSKGGTDDHENRTLACKPCNTRKASKFPFFNIKNEPVSAPEIPAIMMNTSRIRKEWEYFIQSV